MDRVIVHSGTKDMHWHVRRYRGYDGKLTEEGKKRYDYYENKTDRVYNTAKNKQMIANKPYVKSGKWGSEKEDLSRFTTQELKALTERAEAENNYRKVYNTYRNTGLRQFVESAKNFAISPVVFDISAILIVRFLVKEVSYPSRFICSCN